MTKLEKELILEILKDYELNGKVTMTAIGKILNELIDENKGETNEAN